MGYEEYLNITVLQENKPVTYKSMARSLGIHVNKAKQALYEFSKQHSNVHAVYCLTGTTLDNQFKIQLVKDADVEGTDEKGWT
ncbi:DNA polymerase subunit Cdc27-domain-containing protein [Mycotypha africana]|uniref:DNA polymerase subunit Cdc27-domain-containing protein n=1 Tax=Mycotypha africana TaxID=64632 RepID=UPI0022FFF5CF|nr:DNA polymerase subunit Cdc27-domain-containing protein [Mycotypha africana]KAI8970401.1 DNA polymerase subunit Cdc27-domain-containing protein [Mycotypha africana]